MWLFRRNCASTPRQFVLFYCSLASVTVLVASFWTFLGAWTVLPFAAVDLIVVGVAFLVFARHACDYERVAISGSRLCIEMAHGSSVTHIECNARWANVSLERARRPKIEIRYGGNVIRIGAFLLPHRRVSVANESRRALLNVSC
ncbi:DUF2244 domain-containing protein [Caballeronia sp. LZ032]|uniref:DUF2244 domain-containing protein n=1 Tax=Caballeronia sp. LZ032 TaxID=3038565 RepID=UPI0038D42958